MAIVGDVISEGARRAAVGDLTRVLARAGQLARDETSTLIQAKARAPFQLLETDYSTLSRFLDRFEDTALWVDEGNCFNRAMLGAHMLDQMRGFGMGPADDVFTGAIAIKRNHRATLYNADFHAGFAVRLPHLDEPQIVDMVPGQPRLQPLSSWAPGESPELVRPFAGTGVNGRSTWVGGGYFNFAASKLTETWDAAQDFGVTIRPGVTSRT